MQIYFVFPQNVKFLCISTPGREKARRKSLENIVVFFPMRDGNLVYISSTC